VSTVAVSRDAIADALARAKSDRAWMRPMMSVAACVHVAVASALPHRGDSSPAPRYGPVELIDVSVPPPPTAVHPAEPVPDAASVRTPRSIVRRAAPTAAAPVQAPAVLTRASSPTDVVDLTDGFVSGSSSTVAGGAAAAQSGTSPGMVAASLTPTTHAPSVVPSLDRSRRPALAGGLAWACPFPTEADAAGIDDAVVGIRVDVDSSGEVRSVSVPNDPGHGFGRAAQRCAMAKRWTPALDRDGSPVGGNVDLRVRFVR
jgi:protein TonB